MSGDTLILLSIALLVVYYYSFFFLNRFLNRFQFFRRSDILKYIVYILISCLFLSPIVFTQPSLVGLFDFTTTGSIGDTIGGLTSPIIGLINTVLLFITLRRQNDDLQQTLTVQKEHFYHSIIQQQEHFDLSLNQQIINGRNERLLAECDRTFETISALINNLEINVYKIVLDRTKPGKYTTFKGEPVLVFLTAASKKPKQLEKTHFRVKSIDYSTLLVKCGRVSTLIRQLNSKLAKSDLTLQELVSVVNDFRELIGPLLRFLTSLETLRAATPPGPQIHNLFSGYRDFMIHKSIFEELDHFVNSNQ